MDLFSLSVNERIGLREEFIHSLALHGLPFSIALNSQNTEEVIDHAFS